jgi:small-conductance mechanosensitive channel
MLQRFLDSIMFTLVITPYDVGDSVAIDGGAALKVATLNLLTTEVVIKATNQYAIRRNSDLLTSTIVNLTRSSDARFTASFSLDHRATSAQVAAVQVLMGQYIQRHPMYWQDAVSLSAAHAEAGATRLNRVDFNLGLTSRASWGDAGKAWAAYSALTLHLVAVLQHLGLEYREEAWGAPAASWRSTSCASGLRSPAYR